MNKQLRRGAAVAALILIPSLFACASTAEGRMRQAQILADAIAVELKQVEVQVADPDVRRRYITPARIALEAFSDGEEVGWDSVIAAMEAAEPAVRAELEKSMDPAAAQGLISGVRLAITAAQLFAAGAATPEPPTASPEVPPGP